MNELVRRATLESDYEEICGWWKHYGRAKLAWEMLPHLSFLYEDADQKIAVCWLYCSDSTTGFVAFFTTNPAAPKRKVLKAIRMMDECVEGAARTMKMKVLFQFSGGGGFSRKMVKSGWLNTVVQHDFLMKEI
jgi:hypothetical protein